MARVCMDVQHSPMEVHEDKVHTHEHSDSRAETAGKFNLYLELLKEELEMLWKSPVKTWDAFGKEYFYMKGAVLTTVHDYLGYGYVFRPGVSWILRMHEVHG